MSTSAAAAAASASSAKTTASAPAAPERHRHNRTALDQERLAVREKLSNFAPGRCQYPRYGRAGNAHPTGYCLLVQTFTVDQANRLELIHREVDPLKSGDGYAGRFIDRYDRLT